MQTPMVPLIGQLPVWLDANACDVTRAKTATLPVNAVSTGAKN